MPGNYVLHVILGVHCSSSSSSFSSSSSSLMFGFVLVFFALMYRECCFYLSSQQFTYWRLMPSSVYRFGLRLRVRKTRQFVSDFLENRDFGWFPAHFLDRPLTQVFARCLGAHETKGHSFVRHMCSPAKAKKREQWWIANKTSGNRTEHRANIGTRPTQQNATTDTHSAKMSNVRENTFARAPVPYDTHVRHADLSSSFFIYSCFCFRILSQNPQSAISKESSLATLT